MTILQLPIIFLASIVAEIQPSTELAEQALRSATGRALQGNATEAVAILEHVPASEFSQKDREVRACIIERFGRTTGHIETNRLGAVSGEALRLHRLYWKASLLQPETRTAQEAQLKSALRSLLNLAPDAESDGIEAALKQRMAAEGHHVLMGRTPPLLEFIVWATENSEVTEVQLPEGRHPMAVKILDDFASLGWSAYATCDRSFTGGWVGAEAIYAVRPGWNDLTAENFKVSFLAHETQHFSDKERFGELEAWELEYRAKLAELALADTTIPRILSAFLSNQSGDPEVPHSYANSIVMSWLAGELNVADPAALADVPRETIRRAAKALLLRDSASRK